VIQPDDRPVLAYKGEDYDPRIPPVAAMPNGLVMIRQGAELPRRCWKCNLAPTPRGIPVYLRWVDPELAKDYRVTWGAFGAIAALAQFIHGLFKHRVTFLRVPLCKRHLWLHLIKVAAWVSVPIFTPQLIILLIRWKQPGLATAGIAIMLAWLVSWEYRPHLLRALHWSKGHYFVAGAGVAYHRSLPWHDPP